MTVLGPTSGGEEHRIRQRLVEAAVIRLSQSKYDETLLSQMINDTGYAPARVRVYFQSSDDVVMALYARFAGDLESRLSELPDGTVGERFRALIATKFEIMEPYRMALTSLAGSLFDSKGKLGVLSPETEAIRVRVQSTLAETVAGASDYDGSSTDLLSQNLYSVYLALMWLWFKNTPRSKKTSEILCNTASKAMSFSTPYLSSPQLRLPLKIFAAAQRSFLFSPDQAATAKAAQILTVVFRHRRLLPDGGACILSPCDRCLAFHIPKTAYFVAGERPIHLLLPSFPAKSPNRRKTLRALPDMAEEQALLYLANICSEVKAIYPPGVRLTICSDGHVFGNLVGVSDEEVTAYGEALSGMIERLGLSDMIDTFSLRDLYENVDYSAMRDHLSIHYEQPLEAIRQRAATVPQTGTLINGIHRFLFEDNVSLCPDRSRTQIRNECRDLAYKVVQRSDGWGRLLSDCFPMALRLSIHPQSPHSDKIGILLGSSDDIWLTPWHAVAVKENGTFKLMKRHDAEAAGAKVLKDSGYYEL
ncbi:MAG: isocyanide synthase family protein [Pyrinomonadaceae bacterium]